VQCGSSIGDLLSRSLERFDRFFLRFNKARADDTSNYLATLDGWRGISILLVLAAHMLPLGPPSWQLNSTAGPMGMALFFSLSGFLISHFLIKNADLKKFIVRRTLRIVPLAWLYLAIAMPFLDAPLGWYINNFLFYANWPPMALFPGIDHFWSLCIEMQFYFGIAILFFLFGSKSLYICVAIGIAVTFNRVYHEVPIAINTYYRIDEIMAGVLLALVYYRKMGVLLFSMLEKVNPFFVLILFLISCHPESGFINYLRPYLAVLLVGSTLVIPRAFFDTFLRMNTLVYIASISYALYVIHPLLLHTWLGEGDTIEKYLKRPILFILLFILAHISSHHYERFWINFSKRIV